MRKIRAKLTYSNVLVTVLAFIVLGGGAYAATRLPKNSVGTRQLKSNAVNGSKVKDASLTGADLRGPVADSSHASNADHATSADSANHAGTADNATHSDNSDALQGHPASDFMGAGGTAADSDMLGGKSPTAFGAVETAHILNAGTGSGIYGAISGISTASGTEANNDMVTPTQDLYARDFKFQLDSPTGSGGVNFYFHVGTTDTFVCSVSSTGTSCSAPGPIFVPAGSSVAIGVGSSVTRTVEVGFRLTPG